MSKANLNSFAVYDPRLVLDNERSFAILKGGQQVTYYDYPSTAFSSTSWSFTTNPPSKQTVMDRLAFIKVPVTLTFTGDGLGTGNILQPGRDALRSFPISSIIESLTVRLNGFPVSIQMADLIHLLERFHITDDMKRNSMSMFPSMADNVQNYVDADGFNNNPLGQFGDNPNINPRGSYSMTVSSNTTTSAVVNVTIYEPIMLPPFIMDGIKNEAGGFVNLDTVDWNFVIKNNIARMWSRSTANTQHLSNIAVSFTQPSMQLCWITPNLAQVIPEIVTYPYFQINRYVTQSQSTLAYNASRTLTSNVIQFDSIPRKIYLYAAQSQSVIDSSLANTVNTSDTFLKINSVSLNWDNQNGILAGASALQLYNFSAQNGLNIPYTEFNGLTQELSAVGATVTKGLTGSVICIEVGKDLGLRSDQAPGTLSKINFQATVNVTNIRDSIVDITPDLYIVVVYDGVIEIGHNSAFARIGVVSEKEVIEASRSHSVSYKDVERIYGGGDFFSRFKDLGKFVMPYIKKALPIAKEINQGLRDSKAISKALGSIESVPYIGAPAAFAKPLVEHFGYGDGGVLYGGEDSMGGAHANMNAMRRRLTKGRYH